ncbi:hypothetical protein JTX50_000875 [Escherichia coli]|nr:hypothetical protein [Escherichia coli]EFM2441057.1 hypothetical protein [Escherichia coli]EHC2659944.1 hypothetical protein [Escherichia coli]
MKQEFEWFVMDGRAKFNTDDAVVYEALGTKEPSNKKLKRDWGFMGAVLCRAAITKKSQDGNTTQCGDFEYVRGID